MSQQDTGLRIQPHGHLLAVDLDNWRITHASVGVARILGLPPQSLLGALLPGVVGSELLDAWVQSLGWGGLAHAPQRFISQRIDPRGTPVDVVVQSANGFLLIEFQPRAHGYLGVDDSHWLEQLAQRLRAVTGTEPRLRLLGEEMRLLLQHRECHVWVPEERGRLLSPRWAVSSRRGAVGPGVELCDPATLRRHPGRSMQARVIVDVQAEGLEIEGAERGPAESADQWHLAMPAEGERRILSSLGARSAVFAQRWDGERLIHLLVAHSPEVISSGVEAVGGVERLMLIDALTADKGQI